MQKRPPHTQHQQIYKKCLLCLLCMLCLLSLLSCDCFACFDCLACFACWYTTQRPSSNTSRIGSKKHNKQSKKTHRKKTTQNHQFWVKNGPLGAPGPLWGQGVSQETPRVTFLRILMHFWPPFRVPGGALGGLFWRMFCETGLFSLICGGIFSTS